MTPWKFRKTQWLVTAFSGTLVQRLAHFSGFRAIEKHYVFVVFFQDLPSETPKCGFMGEKIYKTGMEGDWWTQNNGFK